MDHCYVAGVAMITEPTRVMMPPTNILTLEQADSGRGMLLMCTFSKFSTVAGSQTTTSALQIIAICGIET